MWDRRAEYLGNNDGDSVKMILDQGFGDTKLVDIRLLGVFAPELNQAGGPECRDFVKEWFNSNNPSMKKWGWVATTARMRTVDREQMTFVRYVATITNIDGTVNLNAMIAQFIHDKGYGGGTGA